MKTLLVIGGTGFFGKSILDAFGRGLLTPWNVTHVIAMSRHADALLKTAPQLVNKRVTLLSADISTTDNLPYADYVIHAAASTDVRDYTAQPEQARLNIQAGTYHYCELAKKFHAKSKIVYVSSGAVYGVQPQDVDKLDEYSVPQDLQNMDAGKQDYAAAKRDAELAIIQLGKDGLNVSIARCFALVGCWLPRGQHFAIGNFIDDVLNHRPITVKAQYKVYRSYMYADDLVEWLMTIVDHASPECPVYNVGSDQAILVGELASELSKKYSVRAEVPLITDAKIDRYIPSIAKAKSKLGLHLKYDLMTSVRETMKQIELQR
jgi:nucleoside-diphosphate-sugar epimerase